MDAENSLVATIAAVCGTQIGNEPGMKAIQVILAVLFAQCLGTAVHAGPYEEGLAAYKKQDYKGALRSYKLAAAQGNAYAQYNLGLMYANGVGVARNYVRADMWLTLAAASADQKVAYSILEMVAAKMTAGQILQAQALAKKCQQSNFKQCG
jgi:TPR repeat protein